MTTHWHETTLGARPTSCVAARRWPVALAACGGGDDRARPRRRGSRRRPGRAAATVNIAVNPWVGYEADAARRRQRRARPSSAATSIYKDLKEEVSWQGFGTGEVDVVIENWGHPDLEKKYITDQKTAVDARA